MNLIPSALYDVPYLPPGEAYLGNLVKDIDIVPTYDFTSTPAEPVKVVYSLTGTLKAYESSSGAAVAIWSKEYTFVERAIVTEPTGSVSLSLPFAIELEPYDDMVESIYTLANVKPAAATLTLAWSAYCVAENSLIIGSPQTSVLVIPVGSRAFTISGERIHESNDSFTVVGEVDDDSVLGTRRNLSIALGLLIALALALQFLTAPTKTSQAQAALLGVMKKLGSRVIGSVGPEPDGYIAVDVASAEDIVKIADELGKPVLHHPGGDGTLRVFYVLDQAVLYRFRVDF